MLQLLLSNTKSFIIANKQNCIQMLSDISLDAQQENSGSWWIWIYTICLFVLVRLRVMYRPILADNPTDVGTKSQMREGLERPSSWEDWERAGSVPKRTPCACPFEFQ